MGRQTLLEVRKKLGLRQKDIASRAGITRAYYALIEKGERTPSLKYAKLIADALDMSLDEFFKALGVTPCSSSTDQVVNE